ncbi:MAG TPA: Gfo/Idh/MocA family oxidoreductase [Chthoniobacterales bacterium]|nr:Gfo/Idh/MocA family oxidoreductase [Chthoniobacterales bacterium]
MKELLIADAIGEVKSIHFEWLLDTNHGADYFRRWHREKPNSGGLMVHKATHHFDLINWWLDTTPETNHIDGARSILTGIAANRSFETGLPVHVNDLLALE